MQKNIKVKNKEKKLSLNKEELAKYSDENLREVALKMKNGCDCPENCFKSGVTFFAWRSQLKSRPKTLTPLSNQFWAQPSDIFGDSFLMFFGTAFWPSGVNNYTAYKGVRPPVLWKHAAQKVGSRDPQKWSHVTPKGGVT